MRHEPHWSTCRWLSLWDECCTMSFLVRANMPSSHLSSFNHSFFNKSKQKTFFFFYFLKEKRKKERKSLAKNIFIFFYFLVSDMMNCLSCMEKKSRKKLSIQLVSNKISRINNEISGNIIMKWTHLFWANNNGLFAQSTRNGSWLQSKRTKTNIGLCQ